MDYNCSATCIGSFPHSDPKEAVDFLLEHIRDFPLWPQLPKRSFLESMYVQYTEGTPCFDIDTEEKKIFFKQMQHIDPSELEDVFQRFITSDTDSFAMSQNYASGLYELASRSQEIQTHNPIAVKGHVTGPVSFALTVTDRERNPLYFDPSNREFIVHMIRMKTLWQIGFLKRIYPKVMMFIDEPYLSGIGSGVISLKSDEVMADLAAVISAVRENYQDVPVAVHCCGNTDWSMIMQTGAHIISFDAYNYGESLLLYEDVLRTFLDNGGALAWGIVPTSGDFAACGTEDILSKFDQLMKKMVKRGFDESMLMRQSFITPACGTGSLTAEESKQIIKLTASVSDSLKKRF